MMAAHEDLSRQTRGSQPVQPQFWVCISRPFFFLVGLAPLRKHHPVRLWAFGVALVFLAVAILVPALLTPLNRLWMQLGRLLGRVTTPIVTGLLFYLIFTPGGVSGEAAG